LIGLSTDVKLTCMILLLNVQCDDSIRWIPPHSQQNLIMKINLIESKN
jgi:hypothetical protein